MRLTLERTYHNDKYTIGKLYIDGAYFCDTLEDCDRGLDDVMDVEEIKAKKVYGETAIPIGIYKVILNYSPKYKKTMPLLLKVKGYEGVRIHSGNKPEDTWGCILVGNNKVKGQVIDSRNTYNALYKRFQQNKGEVLIEIKRKYFI